MLWNDLPVCHWKYATIQETVNEKNNVAPQENDDGNILEIPETNDSANNAKYNKYLFVTEEKVTMLNPLIIRSLRSKTSFPLEKRT